MGEGVAVKDLVKSFGSNVVLNGITLEVQPGEILAIMGSSGGGKTTLLKCISGLIRPTSGEVTVAGTNVRTSPEEARQKMGMVFQSAALFDYLNVRDNVLFGARRWRKLTKDELEQLAQSALTRVGLAGNESLMPAELSGGMRKRVGIARAIALNPSVMLYDEPTTGLDPITAYTIDALIVSLRKELQVTSLVVSHDVSSVFRVADRIAFLHAGELIFVGDPDAFSASKEPAIEELVQKAHAKRFVLPFIDKR
jgi:phospholipid/cholesterol/gamma-HCH transport system ATP-binding protein